MDNFCSPIGPEFSRFSPNISASKAKFENRLDDPESTLLRGSQLKVEPIRPSRLGCRGGASDLGRSSCNTGTSVFGYASCQAKSNATSKVFDATNVTSGVRGNFRM